MKAITNFIIIDDEYLNNFIHSKLIKSVYEEADVHAFTSPQEGLEYIRRHENHYTDMKETILYLDINMPLMTGWEFLQQYDNFSGKIKDKLKVFVVSSSVDANDRNMARNNRNVIDFLEKPLSRQMVFSCA